MNKPVHTDEKLKVLDLFSGLGGFSLGLERTGGFETVAFCEIEEFPCVVLKKHWPHIPIFNDVRTLDATGLGRIDIVTGGYPCQPFSLAGKRDGAEDDRHLWPAMLAVIKAVRPAWVIGENVAGHISMGLDQVLSDLEAEGYACRPFGIPACAKDAPHRRDRVWVIAYDDRIKRCSDERKSDTRPNGRDDIGGLRSNVAHTNASDADKWSHQSKADRIAKNQQVRLNTAVAPQGGQGGSLNPEFVEWLMGYPIGYSALKPSETP